MADVRAIQATSGQTAAWTSPSDPWLCAAVVLLRESGCVVRRWTTGSAVAYTSADDWGIAAPPPRGPVSFGIFAHEIGHQLLHRRNSRPRWLEEVEAMRYSLDQFDRFQLPQRDQWLVSAVGRLGWGLRKSLRLAKDPAAMTQAMLDACGAELAPAVDMAQGYAKARSAAVAEYGPCPRCGADHYGPCESASCGTP